MKGESVLESEQDVVNKFNISVQLVKTLPQSASFSPSYAEATKIYSYFKQSKFGACSIPRPGFWDIVNRAKWDGWSALGDMPPKVAMQNYVEEIKKVYYRIKEIDAFEVKHVEFADVLIPFCQQTGTQMTSKLMEIVKANRMKDLPIQVNGASCSNGITEGDNDHTTTNGMINRNGIDNGSSQSACSDDVLTTTDVCKVPKTVKFRINDNNENPRNDDIDDSRQVCDGKDNQDSNLVDDYSQNRVKVDGSTTYEKEEGELSSSENDSDDEEIYCDSLGPDQILDLSKPEEDDMYAEAIPNLIEHSIIIITETEANVVVKTDPPLFSPIPFNNTFQDTTAQNILTKSDERSGSSSNNSRSDYEVVDVMDEKNSFQSVRKRDSPALGSCNVESRKALDKKRSNRKATNDNEPSEKCIINRGADQACHSCLETHKKPKNQSSIRQNHSGRRNDEVSQKNVDKVNGEDGLSHNNQTDDNHPNHHHHHHHNNNRRSTSEGSNNGGSGDDSCSSLSSSSSDNVGLKIVKALERMDDNMHLILNRLDSIDSSMKILAVQPVQPWWVKHIPSKLVVLSTLWPFAVNIIFYYFWRRRRRRMREKLGNLPINWSET